MEPFYIRQTAEPLTPMQRDAWAAECASDAIRKGAKLCRFTVSSDGSMALVEAWLERAFAVGDQGEPRWSLRA